VDPITGAQVSLASFHDKPIVLNFWASWCIGCRDEAAALRQVSQLHPEVVVLGVDVNDSKSGASKFARKYKVDHPNIFDPDGSLAAKYAVIGLPTTIFLDGQHHVVAKILGAGKLAAFEQGLARATGAGS
jgi:cytochrome c biogenesis protein CcmG/thiol:disulfide interchange protein DsbE